MTTNPKAFLSYSHKDRDIAERIAKDLRKTGIDVWFDQWEILPGDSLIKKVFGEGLSNATAFIVLISTNSVDSCWVNQELDTAFIRRIEGITRVIPVILNDVIIPPHLRPLKWVKLSDDFEASIRELQAAIYGVRERPPIGQPPEFIKNSSRSIGGLSPLASMVGLFLSTTGKEEIGSEETISTSELAEKFKLSAEETDDAIYELAQNGLIKTFDYIGASDIQPTYALFLHFKDESLRYDPEEDIKLVASAVAAQKEIDGPKLQDVIKISPLRINRAAAFLNDYGKIRSLSYLGTAPYDFGTLFSTSATRQFVAENCK
jgi:hypothetical protein